MDKSRGLAHIQALEKRMKDQIRVADVVVVQSYDDINKRVTVKPLVSRIMGNHMVSPPPLLSIPVVMQSRDATLDIIPGDIGVVLYLDLDSDNAIRSGGEGPPNTGRTHEAGDAVFLGVIRKG